jgi:hypothetical protein
MAGDGFSSITSIVYHEEDDKAFMCDIQVAVIAFSDAQCSLLSSFDTYLNADTRRARVQLCGYRSTCCHKRLLIAGCKAGRRRMRPGRAQNFA